MSALRGRRVVVTRSEARAGSLVDMLAALGAEAVVFPAIETKPPESWDALDAALRGAGRYDWVIFTSAAGVGAAFGRAHEIGLGPGWIGGLAVAAVGPATAGALGGWDVGGVVVPDEFVGEAIGGALGDVADRRFLLLRADRASDVLPDRLRDLGGVVEDVVAYRTVALTSPVSGPAAEAVRAGVDAVTFTSPSTVEGFIAGLGSDWRAVVEGARVVTIGPVTSRAAEAAGMRVAAEASPHTIGGLVEALERAFED